MPHIIYRFNCPAHGVEESVFCFRAFDKDNRKLWSKFELIWKQDSWRSEELDKLINALDAIAKQQSGKNYNGIED